jgi:hypothetical protein
MSTPARTAAKRERTKKAPEIAVDKASEDLSREAVDKASEDLSREAVDKAFEVLSRESDVLEILISRSEEIRRLRTRISDQRIADSLAQAFATSPETIRSFIQQHLVGNAAGGDGVLPSYRIDQNDPNYSISAPAAGVTRRTRRINVPASEIRSAITTVMKANKLRVFRITDEKTLNQILDMVPNLKELPKHERNRRIIDSCANRKHGPIMRSSGGQREIVIAA